MKKYLFVFGIIFLFIAACTQQTTVPQTKPSVMEPQDNAIDQEEAPPSPVAHSRGATEINMIAKQWAFEPETITVSKGTRIKLNIRSIDVAHGISIPDFGVNQKIEPGKEVSVEFTADKTGEFTFFCNVYCGSGHKEMKGKLIVQ